MNIPVGISARHVHLSEKDFKELFGEDATMEKFKDLKQYGEFASNLKVTVIGPKGQIENVRVLGPLRSYTQVEVSKTDCMKLGVKAVVRNSGDLEGAEDITIKYLDKEILAKESTIVAARHIHLPLSMVETTNLNDGDIVSVKVSGEKGGVLSNVHVKTGNYFYEMHIDTDDANGFLISNDDIVEIINNGN